MGVLTCIDAITLASSSFAASLMDSRFSWFSTKIVSTSPKISFKFDILNYLLGKSSPSWIRIQLKSLIGIINKAAETGEPVVVHESLFERQHFKIFIASFFLRHSFVLWHMDFLIFSSVAQSILLPWISNNFMGFVSDTQPVHKPSGAWISRVENHPDIEKNKYSAW